MSRFCRIFRRGSTLIFALIECWEGLLVSFLNIWDFFKIKASSGSIF